MATENNMNTLVLDRQAGILRCQGVWTWQTWLSLSKQWAALQADLKQTPISLKGIQGTEISTLDSAGAQLIHAIQNRYPLELMAFSEPHQGLITMVAQAQHAVHQAQSTSHRGKETLLSVIGKRTCQFHRQIGYYLAFFGEWISTCLSLIMRPRQCPGHVLLNQIDRMGFQALPIIGLLSFLIGIVLANQTGAQLKQYGADIYLVNITGIAILREFSPLITAIILAGRTGAALTASLGSMKVNEEIDALATMGFSPFVQLVMPRLIALMIALPLLVIWGDLFGLLGSFIMAQYSAGISEYHFLSQLQEGVPIQHYWIGLMKAPLFALIIGLVGCFQGFQVEYSAESVGQCTTQSVVQSIFLIIIVDAVFAMMFTWTPS